MKPKQQIEQLVQSSSSYQDESIDERNIPDPINLAQQNFDEKSAQSITYSMESFNNLIVKYYNKEKDRKSSFLEHLVQEIAKQEKIINTQQDVVKKKYKDADKLLTEINQFIGKLKPCIVKATEIKDERPVLIELNKLNAAKPYLGCHVNFFGMVSDPFKMQEFRSNLKRIEKCPRLKPLRYQQADKDRLNDFKEMGQKGQEIFKLHHKEMVQNHKDAENILVNHIKQVEQRLSKVEEEVSKFKNGKGYKQLNKQLRKQSAEYQAQKEEYSRLENLLNEQNIMLSSQNRVLESQAINLKYQCEALASYKEDKTRLEQQLNSQKKEFDEKLQNQEDKLQVQIEKISKELGLHKTYNKQLTENIRCPISNCKMFDPVIAEDGHTYEKLYIKEWLSKKNTSPITGEPIGTTLITNWAIRKTINDYNQAKGRSPSQYLLQQGVFRANSSNANNEQILNREDAVQNLPSQRLQ